MWGLLLLGFTLSLLWTVLVLPKVTDFAIRQKWYDLPNDRKVHTEPIVAIGGVGIFTGVWSVFFSLSGVGEMQELGFLILASSILFLVSLRDDLKNIRPIIRLLTQFLVASICFVGGLRIEGFYGLFGIGEVAVPIQYALTVLTIVTVINAYNLIDGVNGLAGSLSLLTCFIFAMLFFYAGNETWALLSIIVGGGVLGFLKYNFGKATLFMGDNGATFLGLLFAVFFIKSLSFSGASVVSLHVLLGTLSVICLPVLDLIRVSIGRMANGKSPFSADRNHVHHLLLDRGKSHVHIALSLTFVQVFLFAFAQIILAIATPPIVIVFLIIAYWAYVSFLKISLGLTAIKAMEYERKELNLIE